MKSERNWGRLDMKSNWTTTTIDDVCSLVTDGAHNSPKSVEKGYYMASVKDFTEYGFDFSNCRQISEEDYEKLRKQGCVPKKDDVLVGKDGARYFEDIIIYRQDEQPALLSSIAILRANRKKITPEFLYYTLKTPAIKKDVRDNYGSGSAIPRVVLKDFKRMPFSYPDIDEQRKITAVCSVIDAKIQVNNAINKNLLEQVLTLYRNKFVDTANNERTICRADEHFDISIGKTPPRKEPQWFSTNPQDVTWVSISDMGTCGLYISSSSEQLTKQAVERHNVKVVPDNTVLLSFKLTVGRIAITNGEMTTNEAIAHFKTDKKEINEYLYCYLKCFNYQTMGSTSSIATAVNSKIIKGMPFVVPTNDELEEFHGFAAPMFAKIKANQIEIDNLTALRDTLLPKLMSGELDVSDIDF